MIKYFLSLIFLLIPLFVIFNDLISYNVVPVAVPSKKRNLENVAENKYVPTANSANNGSSSSKINNNSSKINACVFLMCRNDDIHLLSIILGKFEKQFNSKFKYPYVLLNDQPFTDDFKKQASLLTNSTMEFGLIPKEHWSLPEWIDPVMLNYSMLTNNINLAHGLDINYHHMCRYFSGFFFRHELTLKYDYYIRVDLHANFPCPIDVDPVRTLVDENKLYGFALSLHEDPWTIPTLWDKVKAYLNHTKDDYSKFNFVDQHMNKFGCQAAHCCLDRSQFYNNFEVAPFSLWRDKQFIEYFDYLDKTGGFYYERWGDAPMRSFYLITKIDRKRIRWLHEFSYGHYNLYNFPSDPVERSKCENVTDVDPWMPNVYCVELWEKVRQV